MSKLRWQRKFSALLDWGIVLVAFCSLLRSWLKSVQRRRRRRRFLQQPITVRKPCATVPTHPPICLSSLSHMKEVCVPSQFTQSVLDHPVVQSCIFSDPWNVSWSNQGKHDRVTHTHTHTHEMYLSAAHCGTVSPTIDDHCRKVSGGSRVSTVPLHCRRPLNRAL